MWLQNEKGKKGKCMDKYHQMKNAAKRKKN